MRQIHDGALSDQAGEALDEVGVFLSEAGVISLASEDVKTSAAVQMIFQDPYSSFETRAETVQKHHFEPLTLFRAEYLNEAQKRSN